MYKLICIFLLCCSCKSNQVIKKPDNIQQKYEISCNQALSAYTLLSLIQDSQLEKYNQLLDCYNKTGCRKRLNNQHKLVLRKDLEQCQEAMYFCQEEINECEKY